VEGYFTDAIYIRRAAGKSPELELREKHLSAPGNPLCCPLPFSPILKVNVTYSIEK